MNKSIITSNDAPLPIGPYSQAVFINNMLFVSGQIAIIPSSGEIEKNGIEAETRRVMENIRGVLNAASMEFSDIVKTSIFVKDLNNFVAINNVYGEYFEKNPPARETVEVSRLPKDVNVEISCIAFKS